MSLCKNGGEEAVWPRETKREEGGPNDVYTVTVKTDGTKTERFVQFSVAFNHRFRPEWKLAHGPVKFPACSISHFAKNIIIWLRLAQPPK